MPLVVTFPGSHSYTHSFHCVLPPSLPLSERPNILALRPSRKAAGLDCLRHVTVLQVEPGWPALALNSRIEIKMKVRVKIK